MKHPAWYARVAAALAAGALTLSACSSGSDSDDDGGDGGGGGGLPAVASPQDVIKKTTEALDGKKVRMVLLSDANALQQSWASRAQLMFENTGIDFEYTVSNYDNQVLAQQVQTVIDQKADALMLQNSDVSGLATLIQKAQDAGIYVIVLNLGSNAQSDAFIGPNWDQMAADLADRASEDCAGKDSKKVAIITGFGADTGSVLFEEGATRAFEDNGMEIVATQPGQYDPSKAGSIARTILQAPRHLCVRRQLGRHDARRLEGGQRRGQVRLGRRLHDRLERGGLPGDRRGHADRGRELRRRHADGRLGGGHHEVPAAVGCEGRLLPDCHVHGHHDHRQDELPGPRGLLRHAARLGLLTVLQHPPARSKKAKTCHVTRTS